MSKASQVIEITEDKNKVNNILDWQQSALAGTSLCGGKGANLGQLHRYGFRIPKGGVITATLYQTLMLEPKLNSLQKELLNVSALEVSQPTVIEKLNQIRSIFENISLPTEFINELGEFLTSQQLLNSSIAVRSSATAEDSVNASFAGIHRSFLNVIGLEKIVEAIKGCYASLWTPQALAYRRKMKLSDEQVACAVVLCQMVTMPNNDAPESAGVAFSCDPRTGRHNVFTINAAFGLGEALVSGLINPEEITIVYKRSEFKEIERKNNGKEVLSKDQAMALAHLVWRIHWAIGKGHPPQDVEWAYDGKEFWVLQARPVTRLPYYTSPEIAKLPTVWSTGNIKDAVAGVPTTLTWHMVADTVKEILFIGLDAIGYKYPEGLETVRRINGRGYFEVNTMQWFFYDAFGLMPEETNRGLGGHHPAIPVPDGDPLAGKAGISRKLRGIKFLRAMLKISKTISKDIKEIKAKSNAWKEIDVSKKSNIELFKLLNEIKSSQYDFAYKFQLANSNAGAWLKPITDILTKVKPERASALSSSLLAGTGQVTTAEHGYRLYNLAIAASKDKDALDYLNQKPLIPENWTDLPTTSPFRIELEKFLEEFGHRAVYEAELANPRWNEDPSYLLEQIQLILEIGDFTPPQNKALAVRQKAEQEVAELSWVYRPVLNWLVKKARQGAGLRELSKSTLVAAIEPMRKIFLEIGQRMVKSNLLEAPADIFHLSGADIYAYLTGEWDGLGAKNIVLDNKVQRAIWLSENQPDIYILDSEGNPASLPTTITKSAVTIEDTPNGKVLNGLGVASGRQTGLAKIINHPSEGSLLNAGDVLVAPSTDPGWTPLFLRASAIVMEVGGFLSHGAIVAREYGLPAVVNIPGLLTTVKNGQTLVVDGDKGCVIIKD